MNEHQIFFEDLLLKTEKAYMASEIQKEKLFYSVCATPVYKKSTLLLGFNWGAGQGQEYKPQTVMETNPFTKLDLGSLKRTFGFFTKYLPGEDMDKFVQSNLCFFRSKKEENISDGDLKLSHDLFDSFINYIEPNKVISFSARVKEYLSSQNKLTDINSINISSGTKTFQTTKAVLNLQGRMVPIYFLPHPNYPITGDARNQAWQHCFEK